MMPGFGGPPPIFIFFFVVILVLIVGTIAYGIGKGIHTRSKNNAAPLLKENARIVSKRIHVWGGSGDTSASTDYFITFEFANRSRNEFRIKDSVYGLLVEGDEGILTCQGTRFIGFERN